MFLFFCLILLGSCQDKGPVVLNTDINVEVTTRTFGSGVGYVINYQGDIDNNGNIEFLDLKVEDAARKLLCEYQKINCNGASSKVVFKNPNKTLANYITINDKYKGKDKDPAFVSQAIMKKLEEAKVLTVFERIKEIPRFVIEGFNENRLKTLKTPKDKSFKNKLLCKGNKNQNQRDQYPAKATMRHSGTLIEFISELSFCLGVDIILQEELRGEILANTNMLFDIETTDSEKELISKLAKLGLNVKKHMVKSKYLEVNITPVMVNLTESGIRKG